MYPYIPEFSLPSLGKNWAHDDPHGFGSTVENQTPVDAWTFHSRGGKISNGVSIFSVSMNRTHNLIPAIETWVACKGVDEVVIVDWASTPPLLDALPPHILSNPKVILIRVSNEDKWVLTVAFNLAARMTTKDKILKVDADVCLHPNFIEDHPLTEETFYCGEYTKATTPNEKHLNGLLYLSRRNFFRINGYNERITTYGYDDDDCKNRLCTLGLQKMTLRFDRMSHSPHSDSDRVRFQPNVTHLGLEIQKNRYLCQKMPPWGVLDRLTPWQIIMKIKENYLMCRRDPFWSSPTSSTILTECTLSALRVMLNDHYGIPWKVTLKKSLKDLEFIFSICSRTMQKKLLVMKVVNGLGNRLRALASSIALSRHKDFHLLIVWMPDFHCDCEFDDLFVVNTEDNGFAVVSDITFSAAAFSCAHKVRYDYSTERGKDGKYPYIDCDSDTQVIFVTSACVLNHEACSWKGVNDVLQELKPRHEIEEMVAMATGPLGSLVHAVGVHIRMGQEGLRCEDTSTWKEDVRNSLLKWRTNSNVQIFATEMQLILTREPNTIFYVAADTQQAYDHLIEQFGEKVIFYLKREHYDRSKEQIKSALVDALALSKTKYILGSNWSSFTELAQRLGNKTVKRAGIDFGSAIGSVNATKEEN